MLANIYNTQAPQGQIGPGVQIFIRSYDSLWGTQDGNMANHISENHIELKHLRGEKILPRNHLYNSHL